MHSLLGGRDIALNEETGEMVSYRQDVHDALVKPHRAPCDCAGEWCTVSTARILREGATHTAPEWVYKLVRQVLRRAGGEPDGGRSIGHRALAWCLGGNPDERSLALQTFLSSISGPRVPQLRAYLAQQEADPSLWVRPCVSCAGKGYHGALAVPPHMPITCKVCRGDRVPRAQLLREQDPRRVRARDEPDRLVEGAARTRETSASAPRTPRRR